MRLCKESTVESYLVSQVKALGGWAIKLWPISVSGLPDRMVLLPKGRIFFVELKQPKGERSSVQIVIHKKLAKLGFDVQTLYSSVEVKKWITTLTPTKPTP